MFVFSLTAKIESLTLKDPKPEEEQRETFIAFARIYSGMVRRGRKVFVLGPKYDPAQGLCMVRSQLSVSVDPSSSTLSVTLCVMHQSVINLHNVAIEI